MRRNYDAENTFPEVYTKVIPEDWLINLDKFIEIEHLNEKEELIKTEN